jgi:endonuclease/exonuclease/phosphatase family metal-dependent hydrolase
MINKFIVFIVILFGISSSKNIHLITTNDVHGVIAPQKAYFMNPNFPPDILGWASYYKYVENLRIEAEQKDEGVILLDGGNFFQGNPVGLVDGGKSIIEWMNLLQYDAITLGANDFILGTQNLINLSNIAEFPFLGANLIMENILPYKIKNIDGINIGIIGMVPSNFSEMILDNDFQNAKVVNEYSILKKTIDLVRENGANVVIILASNGIPWDREKVYNKFINSIDDFNPSKNNLNALELTYYASGADIVVTGGVSKGYPEIWYDIHSHVYLTQNYGNGTEFGHIILEIDDKTKLFKGLKTAISGRVGQTLLADQFTADDDILTLLTDLDSRANNLLMNEKHTYPNEINSNDSNILKDSWNIPNLDLVDELEIVTWNCEFFPKEDEITVQSLAEAVSDLNPDLIAFQEIRKRGWFDNLMEYLPEYDFVIAMQSSFMDNAIIFKKDKIRLINQYEPFAENDYNFAGRPPLQCDLKYNFNGSVLDFTIINLHMKCCDSGLLRRKNASKMLHNYVDDLYLTKQKNIIVLGDWNDDLRDKAGEHCFHPFLNDDRMYFVNTTILDDESQVSYPKPPYRSFLDHILVTENLLQSNSNYRIMTIPIDDYMGGYDVYEKFISDHKPVMVGIPLK